MSVYELEGSEGVYVRDFRKTLQVHEVSCCSHYSVSSIRDVGGPTRNRLLGGSNTYATEAHNILATLKVVDKETCALLGVRQNAFDTFSFRLLQSEQSTHMPDDRIQSFIVLSYTWHSPAWKPHSSILPLSRGANDPLTPAMWSAFLAQLLDHECFWVDQLCINQCSESEKTAAVAHMDLIYQSARKVVIALEDVAVSSTDAALMFMYANVEGSWSQTSENDRRKFSLAFKKIIAARWFGRAWCLHEFLVSRRHVFLVPIWQIDDANSRRDLSTKILRINGPFLAEMYRVFIEQDIEDQNFGRESLLNSRNVTGIEIDKIRRFFNRLTNLGLQEVFGSREKLPEDGSFMYMFHEVFSHNAVFDADKVSMILNIMRSGLYLKPSTALDKDDCLWLITLTALAAGDTTALTTNGPRPVVDKGRVGKNRHWIRIPSSEDQARRRSAITIPRTTIDVKVVEDGLELEILFLGASAILTAPSQHYLSIARWLIDHRALCKMSLDEQEMRIDTEADELIYVRLRISYIQTLACALACGKEWMLAYYVNSYGNLPSGMKLQWSPITLEIFTQAIDWALSTVIEQDIDSDLRDEWQDAGTLMWADEVSETQKEDTSPSSAVVSTVQINEGEQHWTNLLDLTETLINFGLAISPAPENLETEQDPWNVQICTVSGDSKFLVYAPTSNIEERLHLGVPKALQDDAYSWMSRVWLLQEHEISSHCRHFSLRGKSRLAGNSSLPKVPGIRVTIIA